MLKITKRQLRRIIREAIDPREMEEPLGGWISNALHNDPDYRHHTDTDHFKIGDLVRSVGYEGDGWGGDYERSVGDQIGTVIEITPDQDGTQYTVHFPDGTTVMDTPSEFEVVKEDIINEGFFDKFKSAVGLGKNEQEMLLDIQKAFEKIATGINDMVALGKAGSRMKSKKGDLFGDNRDGLPDLMPDDAWNPKGTGLMNIFTAIKNLDGTDLGSIDLAGVAPDAAEEMNALFDELQQTAGPRVKPRLLRKIGGLGSKILDEYNEFGPDDDGAGLEAFYDVLQDAMASEVKMAWTPTAWWETYGDEISGLSEGTMKITKRQLRRIIKEAVLREGIADPRGLKALLASLNVKGRDFGPVANALALAYHDSEGAPQDMKDEVEIHSGGLSTSTDGVWIDWPIETYQEIWNLYKKAEQSYQPSQASGPRW